VDGTWALNRSLIWFDVFSTLTTRERLYWTSDGGRSWSSGPAPGHSLNAGATSSVQFTTARRGWLTAQESTGPGAELYRTTDGGLTWHRVATGPPSPLRQVAPVEAGPAGELWQAGGLFSDRLERTTDGGKHWRAINLTGAPRPSTAQPAKQPWYSLHAFFPHQTLTTVAVPHGRSEHLLVYASRDRGRSWVRLSDLHLPGQATLPDRAAQPVRVAFTSPRAWWALVPGRHPRLFRTADSGQRWQPARLPAGAQAWQLAAADARHGWVLVTAANGSSAIVVTANGGRTWHLITFCGACSRADHPDPHDHRPVPA
jgi:BNR/Asp-box repeat protein